MNLARTIAHRIRSSRLSTKLALLTTLLIALISVFIYLYFPARLEQQAIDAIAEKSQAVSNITAFGLSSALVFEDSITIRETLESARQVPSLVYIVVEDNTGKVLGADNLAMEQTIHPTMPEPGNHLSLDGEVLCTTTSIVDRGKEIGRLTLGLSLQALREEVKSTQRTIALVSVLIFLLGMVSVISISRAVIKPLTEMVNTVESIADGDLTHRAAVLSQDEIGHLATSFNTMVDRLQAAYTELEAINQSLEQRVLERTRALEQEINERKRSEAALRESEERYRQFFDDDLTGDYIATIDGKLLACNTAFARMFGFASIDEALCSNLQTRFLDAASFESFLHLLRNEKKLEYREETLLRNDGESVHVVQNVIGTFDDQGELVSLRGYLFDDTRRKQLEQQLLHAQKMESIGVLAGGIAHEFNNLLGVIVGFAHLARDMKGDPGQTTHALKAIITASERGAGLVRQLPTLRMTATSSSPSPIREAVWTGQHASAFLNRFLQPKAATREPVWGSRLCMESSIRIVDSSTSRASLAGEQRSTFNFPCVCRAWKRLLCLPKILQRLYGAARQS